MTSRSIIRGTHPGRPLMEIRGDGMMLNDVDAINWTALVRPIAINLPGVVVQVWYLISGTKPRQAASESEREKRYGMLGELAARRSLVTEFI